MDCKQAVEAVSAALDGELTAAEQAELEAHLSVCPACRALAEDFSALNAAMTENEPAPPLELADRVMARIAEENRVVHISAGRRPGRRRWMSLAAAAALVVCAGGLGVWLKNGGIGMDGASGAPMAYSSSSLAGTSGGSEQADADIQEPTAYDGVNSEVASFGIPWWEDQPAPAMAEPGAAPSSKVNAPEGQKDIIGSYEPAAPEEPATSAAPAAPAGGKQPTVDNVAVVNEEEALELVFEYLGGYERFPAAKLRYTTAYGSSTPGYCLKTEEAEEEATLEYCLDYVGVSSNALYHEIHLYENVTYEEEKEGGAGGTVTCNWFAVEMDGSGEILVKFPENYDAERESEYIDSYVNAVTGD